MIALVEGASRKKTPNEIALNTLLVSLTIIFLIVVVTMYPFGDIQRRADPPSPTLIALLVCLIPTTIGGLLSAIGIAGHGPCHPLQRHRHVRQGGGGLRRRGHHDPG